MGHSKGRNNARKRAKREEEANGGEIKTGLNFFHGRTRGALALRLITCVIP